MSNTGEIIEDSDGKLSIKSNINNWDLISDNVCTKLMYYLIYSMLDKVI